MTSRPHAVRVARRVIAVGSGKGGVGKSTVALNVALALAEAGDAVGLLDADVHGPNIPLLMNLARVGPASELTLWSAGPKLVPVERFGLKVMSAGFLLGEQQSLSIGGGLVRALAHRLTAGVDWGEPDWLVVDLPPGTADVLQVMLGEFAVDGVVLVVTPQDVAHLDARRALDAYLRAGVRVLGAVENMAAMACPHCDREITVFRRVAEERSVFAHGALRLGDIPLDPDVSASGDRGSPVLVARADSAPAEAVRAIAGRIRELVG